MGRLSGVFAEWQPVYAAHGIATFPVSIVGKEKKPAVKHWIKIGHRASDQFALKFPRHDAIGFACRYNKITVLDIDTPDERILADELQKHGPTPFIVRSGSGNYQAWYRHGGEGRRVRPDPLLPVDILGDGYVVAPPSRGTKGPYAIIQGSLDDLDKLPRMRKLAEPTNDNANPIQQPATRSAVREGNRNVMLWRHCMKVVQRCSTIDELVGEAMRYNNDECSPALAIDELVRAAKSAWQYETDGKNFFGQGPRLVLDIGMVDRLAAKDARAFALISILLRHHAGSEQFILANAMAVMFGWSINTFKAARDVLVAADLIECMRPGGKGPNDPPVYRFLKGVRN